MALTRVTKHIVHGSLLVQFKYTENAGDWDLTASQSTYTEINGKNILMTPQYADSIIENQASMTSRDISDGQNLTDSFSCALFVNGSNEYEETGIRGVNPYGNDHSHTGGRNDRTAPTRRHGHVTNFTAAMGINHAYTPATTNELDMDIRVKNSATRSIRIRDFFFIAKEISIGLASSGAQ